MENLLLYFAKVNGLIVAFYLLYLIFLQKETFYVSNRWYFLIGLGTAVVLPLITFTTFVWIEVSPVTASLTTTPLKSTNSEVYVPNWMMIVGQAYVLITFLLLAKIGIEWVSFFSKTKMLKKQIKPKFTLVYSNAIENPYSFFNYIVINPKLFTTGELEHIMTHETIHVQQLHSVDVLISKLFCALFWINPIIWKYRRAILQNLEFIADSATLQHVKSKYEYQKTLLKVVTQQQSLSITNQFYQSLIKKRIIMLHTNHSQKKNSWKYATILPVLVGFMLLFQIKTVAQYKTNSAVDTYSDEAELAAIITSTSTDTDITKIQKNFESNDYMVRINNLRRNKNGEIIAIKLSFSSRKNMRIKNTREIKGDLPIRAIKIFVNVNASGDKSIVFEEVITLTAVKVVTINNDDHSVEDQSIKLNSTNVPANENSERDSRKKTTETTDTKAINNESTKGFTVEPGTVIYLNNKVISNEEMNKIDPKSIQSVDVIKEKLKNEIKIVTRTTTLQDTPDIIVNKQVYISKEEADKMDVNEIESVHVTNKNGKTSIEIQKKKANSFSDMSSNNTKAEIEKAKAEIEKAKAEIEKAKAEIEKAKAEIKKVKVELGKAKIEKSKSKSQNTKQ